MISCGMADIRWPIDSNINCGLQLPGEICLSKPPS